MMSWEAELLCSTEGIKCEHAVFQAIETAAQALGFEHSNVTRRIVIRRLACVTIGAFCIELPTAQAANGENLLAEVRPVLPEDLAFLRAEGRLRKQKQIVRPDGLRTAGEAKVLSTAIDGIIIFGISLSYGLGPKSPGRKHITDRGLRELVLPPHLPHDASQRHYVSRLSGWDVRSPTELAVTADFSDVSGVRPPVLNQRLVFIVDAGVWKFDHYEH